MVNIYLNQDALTNSVQAHTDSVTSLTLFNDIYLFSTSHDTKIKMWDIRNLNACVQEQIVYNSHKIIGLPKEMG
jgi:WD40 repeat protein